MRKRVPTHPGANTPGCLNAIIAGRTETLKQFLRCRNAPA